MLAYIEQLRRQVEKLQAEGVSPAYAEQSSVTKARAKHDAWYASLPYAAKHRHWSMEELSSALGFSSQDLSQTLLDAGWRRKRIWFERSKGNGRYLRVWLSPDVAAKEEGR